MSNHEASKTDKPEIHIIGGGVAGLSAAHELLARGFRVSVYERKSMPGGKARSIDIEASDYPHSRKPLPAEHGFRFFPGFYRHLDETMAEIPGSRENSTVADALVRVDHLNYGRLQKDVVTIPTHFPGNVRGFLDLVKKWTSKEGMEVPWWEFASWFLKMLRVSCSCDERINEQYERWSWWEFLDTYKKSTEFKRYVGNGSRLLVAADPHKASARTSARINEQMFMDQMERKADRVLDGPTNQAWIFPWMHKLLEHGEDFKFYTDVKVTEFTTDASSNRVTGFTLQCEHEDGQCQRIIACDPMTGPQHAAAGLPEHVTGDQFICAVPVEVAAEFIRKRELSDKPWTDLSKLDPALRTLDILREDIQWMNGVLFYLKGDAGSLEGHSVYVDSPFALSSVFQQHYWHEAFKLDQYGNGDLTGILSVVVSNWIDTSTCPDRPSCDLPNCGEGHLHSRSAKKTFSNEGKQALIDEIWADLKTTLTINGQPILDNKHLEYAFVDPAIRLVNGKTVNDEPLLVNRANRVHLRPHAVTAISNFFLAGDYVRTETDLATMEAANESTKLAVNGLLDALKDPEKRCTIHPFPRPKALAWLRRIDRWLYRWQTR